MSKNFKRKLLGYWVLILASCGPDDSPPLSAVVRGGAPVEDGGSIATDAMVPPVPGAEGEPCSLGTIVNCDADCGSRCGTSPRCTDLCCREDKKVGVVCHGKCEERCSYDQGHPACGSALRAMTPGKCTIEAMVNGVRYSLVIVETHDQYGIQQFSIECRRQRGSMPSERVLSSRYGCEASSCSICEYNTLGTWEECCGFAYGEAP